MGQTAQPPMHCWNPKSLKAIGDALGKYIDMASPKDQYACARICVEVDLEAGLPEAIKLTVGSWSHFQKLDYEQLPFKCRGCHEYGHFIRNCPKKPENQQDKAEGWQKVSRSKTKHQSGKGPRKGEGTNETRVTNPEGSGEATKTKATAEIREEPIEIGEKSSNEGNKDSEADISAQPQKDHEEEKAPVTEGETLGKSDEDSGSEEEEEEEGEIEITTPRMLKTRGRKSRKEIREQAAYKDKLQGSQLTLEKLLNTARNTRQQGHAQKGTPKPPKSK